MDDLAFVRGRIESYGDYTNGDTRRLSDEQIRAYLGEALARMHERLHGSQPASESLANVLLRCQFADQLVVRALDSADLSARQIATIHAADRNIVALADRADTVAATDVDAYVAEVTAALDSREVLMRNGKP